LLPGFVARRTLDKDESVRWFGLTIGVVGVLVAGAVNVSPQFFRIPLLESRSVQNGFLLMAILFVSAIQFYGVEWKKLTSASWTANKWTEKAVGIFTSRWGAAFVFAATFLFVSATWELLYGLTEGSLAAVFGLIAVQVAIAAFCYVRFRNFLAA
jgi:hypothetical protein